MMTKEQTPKKYDDVSISEEMWNRYRFLTIYAAIVATIELVLVLVK
jgi:hypothetical protein